MKIDKDNLRNLTVGFLLSAGIGFGCSNNTLQFLKFTILSFVILYIMWYIKNSKNDDSKLQALEDMLTESDGVISEQEEVIKEYETILDTMATRLPCVCGGNTFEGLFQPGSENYVECEKCNAKYKVMVSFDSILVSETMEKDIIQDISKL